MSQFRLAELALTLAVSALILSIIYSSYTFISSLANLASIKPSIYDEYIVLEGLNLRNDGLYSVSITISIDILQGHVRLARYTGDVRLKPGENVENLALKLEDGIHIPLPFVDRFAQFKEATVKTMFRIVIEPLISIKLEINETLGRLIL